MTPRRVRWRRWLIRLTLCLLLGAVTTVGVAWGCVVRTPVTALDPVPFYVINEAAGTNVGAWRAFGVAVDCSTEAVSGSWEGLARRRVEAGWPLRALRLQREDEVVPMPQEQPWPLPTEWRGWKGGVLSPRQPAPYAPGYRKDRFLPLSPIWPGFLIDSLVHAVPWWALLLAPGFVKGWRRKRREACVACGYDLHGLGDGAACPECGQAARGAARHRPVLSGDC